MINQNITELFLLRGREALELQKIRISMGNQKYSYLVESHIRGHPKYPKLAEMRRNKLAKRKETAKLVKRLLKEQLTASELTMKDFNLQFEKEKNDEAYQLVVQAEKIAFKNMTPLLKKIPVYWWLKEVRGLGTRYAVKLLVYVRDPRRFHHPSALRKYCGTAPGMIKRKRTEAHFVPKLKGIMIGQMAKNFLMNDSQYKTVYDHKKEYYTMFHVDDLDATEQKKLNKQKVTHEDWTPIRIHNYSLKPMINRFVDEFWQASFLINDEVPPANPYILNNPMHTRQPMIVPVTEEMKKLARLHYDDASPVPCITI